MSAFNHPQKDRAPSELQKKKLDGKGKIRRCQESRVSLHKSVLISERNLMALANAFGSFVFNSFVTVITICQRRTGNMGLGISDMGNKKRKCP